MCCKLQLFTIFYVECVSINVCMYVSVDGVSGNYVGNYHHVQCTSACDQKIEKQKKEKLFYAA